MTQLNNTVNIAAVSQENDSFPSIETQIVSVSQPSIDTASLVAQMESALTLIAETPKEQLDRVKSIRLGMPVALITGEPYIAEIILK